VRLRLVMLAMMSAAAAVAGQVAAGPQEKASHAPASAQGTPEAVVRELYREVVARKPLGLPEGPDWPALRPFLSKELIRRIDTARTYQDGLLRQLKRSGSGDKLYLAWGEFGLFSGPDDDARPSEATVGRTEPTGNGSFRLRIRLTWRSNDKTFSPYIQPPPRPISWQWSVCAVVTSEDGHYVVDDVLFFKDEEKADPKVVGSRLSHVLTIRCDGPRWTGQGIR
jgi:hypothetical protein